MYGVFRTPAAVAPLVGAWIEIRRPSSLFLLVRVAPLVGAWIEMVVVNRKGKQVYSRSPCGSVD